MSGWYDADIIMLLSVHLVDAIINIFTAFTFFILVFSCTGIYIFLVYMINWNLSFTIKFLEQLFRVKVLLINNCMKYEPSRNI